MQVLVRDNNVDQALRVLKKKMQREGILRELKERRAYEKPSEKRTREKAEAIRRARKAARKRAQREGLLPAPPKKVFFKRPLAPSFESAVNQTRKERPNVRSLETSPAGPASAGVKNGSS